MSATADNLSDLRGKSRRTRQRRAARATSSALTSFSLVLSVGVLIAIAVVVVAQLASPDSPAFFRAAMLIPSAFFATVGLSVYVDEELFDFYTAFTSGALAILVNFVLLYFEIGRAAACAGIGGASQTPLENRVCTLFASQRNLVPIVSAVVSAAVLILYVMLFFWHRQRRAYLLLKRDIKLRNSSRSNEVDRQILMAAAKRRLLRIKAALRAAGSNPQRVATMVLSVLQVAIVVFVMALAIFYPNAAAFYRSSALLLTTFAAASEMAFFGTTPRNWTWLVLAFSILSAAATIISLVFEFPRMIRCLSGSLAPVGITEQDICVDEGFLSVVVPFALLTCAGASIATAILSATMIGRGTSQVALDASK